MARPLVLGNGSLVVGIDKYGQIRNFYYPHPGKEDHVKGHRHKLGVWFNNKFSWFANKEEWEREIKYKRNSLIGDSIFINRNFGLFINIQDTVYPKKDIYIKKIIVKNTENTEKNIRFFINSHFHVGGDDIGDTVYFNPYTDSLINYKGKRYFLINGSHRKNRFFQFATGAADEGDKEGTYRDAEDGELSGNPIEHGSVDSTISFNLFLKPLSEEIIYYWIAAGARFQEVKKLNLFVLKKSPEKILKETEEYWKRWLSRIKIEFNDLEEDLIDLFKLSLMIIKAHTSENGAIVASIDTEPMGIKKDTYNYVWPRDGALISRSLDKAGYRNITKAFFNFCSDVSSREGFLFHRYLPDKSLGSSWHPWIDKNGNPQLPIQEDETALVLDALWKKYTTYKEKEFMREIYKKFIKKAANFLYSYRDKKTKLPNPTYDLWEEKLGIHTFTCCTVYAGLIAAHNFSRIFGSKKDSKKFLQAAEEVKKGILKYLYDENQGIFIKGIFKGKNDQWEKDYTTDISTFYGLFEYNVLNIDDIKLTKTFEKIINDLRVNTNIGGFIRYKGDSFFKDKDSQFSNPWFITTFWIAEYYIAKAKTIEDLEEVKKIFNWALKYSLESKVFSEQIHPLTGAPLSAAPLTWSHAGYIIAFIKYLDKLKELKSK